MNSPPWEPPRPPSGPQPGWHQPNPYGPAGGQGNPPPWPGQQWQPAPPPPDDESYQAGRAAAENGSTMVKFGGAAPEEYCEQQFVLSTPVGKQSDFNRGDFMDGCVDAMTGS